MSTYTFPAGRFSNTDTAFIKAYIDQEVAGVLDLAPEDLNTLNELAAAINDDPNYFATVGAQVAELNADVVSVVTALGVAEDDTSMGTFTAGVLPDASDLKAVLEAFALAWQTAKDNIEAAADALSGRLDTLEADPTTAAAVAAVQADVDQNELDSDAAESALSGRLDVLEADPTTATAVAAGDAATLASANAYTDSEITTLIGGAPGVLDTLKELSDSLGGDSDFITTINASIAAVQSDVDQNETDSDSADAALSGRLDVLEADPTTAAAVAAVQADVDQNESDGDAADAALSGRLDVLEADPTTATAVAAVQADVDQNELDGDAADAALSGRLDVLEADPTTAAAVAAVQADVDQNETDSDAADAALSGRLDVLEADPTTATAVAAVQSDVDQNEADADAAIALKLNIANPAATGDLTVDTNARLQFDSNLTKVENVLRGTRMDIGNNITVYPAAAGGRFEIEGGLYIRLSDLEEHNNDTDAGTAGIVVGGVYYDSNGHLRIRRS